MLKSIKHMSNSVATTIDLGKKFEVMYNSFDDLLVKCPGLIFDIYADKDNAEIIMHFEFNDRGYEKIFPVDAIKRFKDVTLLIEYLRREVINTLLKVGGVDVD
jgi:hypothetical protein